MPETGGAPRGSPPAPGASPGVRAQRIGQGLAVVAAGVSSVVAYPRLPDRVPMHWNFSGEVDGWGGPLEAALVMPLLMLGLWGLLRVLPRLDPRRESYAQMRTPYETAITATLLLLLGIHVALLANALGHRVAMPRVALLGTGLLFAVLGLVLPGARPNWFFGIRTPWTLTDDRVWARTHRVGGAAFLVAGIGLVAGAVLGVPSLPLFVATAVAAVLPVPYSYLVWRRLRREESR